MSIKGKSNELRAVVMVPVEYPKLAPVFRLKIGRKSDEVSLRCGCTDASLWMRRRFAVNALTLRCECTDASL
jgi:hypothetical protein